jgi:hypothetical protein
MSNNYEAQARIYAAKVQESAIRAGPVLVGLVAAGWIAFPFAVQTVLHPSDAIALQYAVQGQRVPRVFTAQQETVGFIEAVLALAVLVMFQLVGTVLFYRRAKMDGASVATPALWPLAALLAGVVGNAAWFLGTGQFDVGGCLVGLSSAALTVGGEMLCNRLGREFVMGVPAQPWHSPALLGSPAQLGQAPLLYSESGQGPVHYHIPD